MSKDKIETKRIPARHVARELTADELRAVCGAGGGNTRPVAGPGPGGLADSPDTNYN